MGMREKLNNTPVVGVVIAVVMVGLAVFVLAGHFSSGPSGDMYYTTDDGQTWFVDSQDRVPPFEVNGQQAVRAYVFSCDGEEFVGYLERYTPEAAEQVRRARAAGTTAEPPPAAAPGGAVSGGPGAPALGPGSMEQKRPGDAEWTPLSNFAVAGKIRDVRCPDGTYAHIVKP